MQKNWVALSLIAASFYVPAGTVGANPDNDGALDNFYSSLHIYLCIVFALCMLTSVVVDYKKSRFPWRLLVSLITAWIYWNLPDAHNFSFSGPGGADNHVIARGFGVLLTPIPILSALILLLTNLFALRRLNQHAPL